MTENNLSFLPVRNVAIVRYRAAAPASEIFDVPLPQCGKSIDTEFAEILWRGPEVWWLKSRTDRPSALIARLSQPEYAIDCSDAFATFAISGTLARTGLAMGCPVDLHPRAFPEGSVAATRYDLFDIVLHARPEGSFDIHLPRSYAEDAWRWMERAFARLGRDG